MEVGAIVGLGLIGYLLNQKDKDTKFKDQNDKNLKSYIQSNNEVNYTNQYAQQRACADTYPLYAPEYVRHQQNNLQSQSQSQSQSQYNPSQYNQQNKQHKEHFSGSVDFMPANDPTNDLLLDLKERPMTDFLHNNMVPFYGSEVKQNMAGTGISSGNYIDGTDVNSGYDDTTPNQTLLATFTGMDDTWMHKRETGPFFSPAETQTGWVYGMPLFRPDMDRYTESLNNFRHDLKPIESIQVGPGLNIDPSIPASGGFHEFTRILPNNVNDYKVNQLENRVNAGKFHSAGLPTSYPGIGISGQDYTSNLRPNNGLRDQTSFGLGNISSERNKEQFGNINTNGAYGSDEPCVNQEITIGQGPIGSHIPQGGTRSTTYMSLDNNIRSTNDCNSQPIGNAARPGFGHANLLTNWYVNETDRGTVAPNNIEQLNLNRQGQGSTFWTCDDEPGTTRRETTEFSHSGNPGRQDQGTKFWTYDDGVDTTRRETTEYSHAGNPERRDQGTKFWTYDDTVSTSRKETTEFSHAGNPIKLGDAMMSRQQFTGYEIEVDN
jgi:hypothetical protein